MYLLNHFLSSLKIIVIKAGVRLTGIASGRAQVGQMLEGSSVVAVPWSLWPIFCIPSFPGAVGFVAPLTLTLSLVLTFLTNVS